MVNVGLRGRTGTVHVEVDPECERAFAEVSTPDVDGRSGLAVTNGTLDEGKDSRVLTVDIKASGADPRDEWGVDIWVTVPLGCTLNVHTDVADVETTGPKGLRETSIETTTGAVTVEDAIKARIKTVSGRIDLGRADEAVVRTEGPATHAGEVVHARAVNAAERAHVTIGYVYQADVQTTSGDVSIEELSGRSTVVSTSGRITAVVTGSGPALSSGPADLADVPAPGHTFSSPNGIVNVTLGGSVPSNVRASDMRGPIHLHLSEELVAEHGDVPQSSGTWGAGAGAGGAAAAGPEILGSYRQKPPGIEGRGT